MLMNQKGFETPEMWRMVMVGAVQLLADGGCLFMYDNGCGRFDERDTVEAFALRLGLKLLVHDWREDVPGAGIYAVVFRKEVTVGSAVMEPTTGAGTCTLVGQDVSAKPRCPK